MSEDEKAVVYHLDMLFPMAGGGYRVYKALAAKEPDWKVTHNELVSGLWKILWPIRWGNWL